MPVVPKRNLPDDGLLLSPQKRVKFASSAEDSATEPESDDSVTEPESDSDDLLGTVSFSGVISSRYENSETDIG